jgi:hypothetical protein
VRAAKEESRSLIPGDKGEPQGYDWCTDLVKRELERLIRSAMEGSEKSSGEGSYKTAIVVELADNGQVVAYTMISSGGKRFG